MSRIKEYLAAGISLVPVNKSKEPTVEWTPFKSNITKDISIFKGSWGIAAVGGKVSGNLECIDIDSKYDPGNEITNGFLTALDPILHKLVMQRTTSGGYHLVYRCEKEISGNKKLAMRLPNEEELKKNPKAKFVSILETRGEGGYFLVSPSPGYDLITGDFTDIQTITWEEREFIFETARSFNEYFTETKTYTHKPEQKYDQSPFDDYNQRGDVIALLERHGWDYVESRGDKHLVKRPGATSKTSGNWNSRLGWFSVFSTNTEFEVEKGYKAYAVYAILECGGDFNEACKRLLNEGYGKKYERKNPTPLVEAKAKVTLEDDDMSFLASQQDMDLLDVWRRGEMEMGLTTGYDNFDKYFRYKLGNFVLILGHVNVGKSYFVWWLMVVAAKLHGWKWIVYTGENSIWSTMDSLMQFYMRKPVQKMSDEEYEVGKAFVKEHFTFISNYDVWTYKDLINMAEKLLAKKDYQGFSIDPYNSLDKDLNGFGGNSHEYDYTATNMLRNFCRRTNCGIWLNVHTTTEASRRRDKATGRQDDPEMADVEGGMKFSSRADDVIVANRYIGDAEEWMWTRIHIRKIKETKTGGMQTLRSDPCLFTMSGYGFKDNFGRNPFDVKTQKQIDMNKFLGPDSDLDIPF